MQQLPQLPNSEALDQFSDYGYLRLHHLLHLHLIPYSATTLWRRVKSGDFPAPAKLSAGITAWRISDLKQWAADPISYRNSAHPTSLNTLQPHARPPSDVENNHTVPKPRECKRGGGQ